MIASWAMWRIPRPIIALVLCVDTTAVVLAALSVSTVHQHALILAAFLASLSITYSFVTRHWERVRRALHGEVEPESVRNPNLLASWSFTAAILLPLWLAAVVMLVAATAEWPSRNIARRGKLYRYAYSTAGAVLAMAIAHRCVELPVNLYLAMLIAVPLYEIVNLLPVAAAMLAAREISGLDTFLKWSTYRLELSTMTVACAQVALLHSPLPMMAWLSLPATIALQRHATKANIRAADDPHRRPMNEEAWLLVAREVIAACPVGAIMRVDTTDPAAVSYLARVQAGCDAIGMAGKSGLAVLLTECPDTNADALAVRLRAILHRQNISAQVAVAAKPRDGQSLDDLLAVSEAELIARVAANRSANSERPEA